MSESTDTNIEKRQMLRATIELLAGPLEGDARDRFLSVAEGKLNDRFPPPSARSMKAYLKTVK